MCSSDLAIVDTLVADRRIELRNFGVFEVKKRAARKARNPRTGERVEVAEKYVVTFKPGKEMEERVRQLEEEAARAAAARIQAAQIAAANAPAGGGLPINESNTESPPGTEQPAAYNTTYAPRAD